MRRLLLALLALLAAPAATKDRPAWAGVWDGKVGTYPVRLCIDVWGDGPGHGSYYYLSQLEPISLSEEDGEGGWIERTASGETEALWEHAVLSGARLRGTWSQGDRRLKFDLKPIAWTEGEWGGPCGSEAFMGPRVRPAEITDESAELEGWSYVRHRFVPAAHFTEEVSIESFSFAPEQPGDAAILAALDAHLPRGTVSDAFIQCLAGGIASLGTDGYFEKTVRPMLATRAFLAVDEANSDYCGGAHPNHWQVMHTFDRRSGAEIDLFDWIGEPRIDGEDSVLAEGLKDLVVARWPAADAECSGAAAEADLWQLGLAREGLVFQPDLPHVITACEERVVVEWAALAPFLDADGRAGLARLRD